MAFLGWFDGELRPDAWFDAELQPAGWFDTEIINTVSGGGGITGTAATSQAQTASLSGSATVPAVTGTLATSQAQSVAATGTASPAAVSGTVATRQAQTTALAGSASPANVSGTGTASQGQTSAASGSFAGSSGVSGVASTSQGQTVSSSGSVVNPDVGIQPIGGGFIPNETKRSKPRKLRHYDDVEPDIIELIEKKAEISVQPKKRIASESQMRSYMVSAGIPYQSTHRQIYLELVQEMRQQAQDDDEAIATLIAMMI
jgi:hypothetical protein